MNKTVEQFTNEEQSQHSYTEDDIQKFDDYYLCSYSDDFLALMLFTMMYVDYRKKVNCYFENDMSNYWSEAISTIGK